MVDSKAAEALIEKIRRENTLDGAVGESRFGSFVRQSLRLVSEQLYNKSTHFLLELLQNADDNEYTSKTPTLCISYQPGSLRIDCNEVGFTGKNVEAICTIGGSTKVGSDNFTGEKGIGFKSVFKVADIVWISSREFKFKFDTIEDGELGMIAPRWDAFPGASKPGYTSFYLKISDRCNENELMEEITSFDSSLLIFLRKLKTIELSVTRKDGSVWSERLQRDNQIKPGYGMVKLTNKSSVKPYITWEHTATELPPEPKRPNIHQSKIVLAFPASGPSEMPTTSPQKVYAFLPIRDYGFRFMIQADFLLTANREDIDQSSKWNIALRSQIVDAFLEAVDRFNCGPMRYHWPHYVPTIQMSSFFMETGAIILEELSKRSVLLSCSNRLEQPSSLTYVPLAFKDKAGIPFPLDRRTASQYLSLEYPEWEIEAMKQLGLKCQSPINLLEDLHRIGNSLHSKPKSWHSQLAQALLPHMASWHCRSRAEALDIIPIKGGGWLSTQGHAIYFSRNAHGISIPSGIDILIVEPKAAQDDFRRKFFEQIGVKECDTTEVCRAIVRTHSNNLSIRPLTRQQLVAHATYLYESSWRTSKVVQFRFAMAFIKAKNDLGLMPKEIMGYKSYVRPPVQDGSPEERIYNLLQTKFDFIHEDYAAAIPSVSGEWRDWLLTSFGISTIPRLTEQIWTRHGIIDRFVLSEEMRFLFFESQSSDILWILREHWSFYSKWIEDDPSQKISADDKDKLREYIGLFAVRCRNGVSVPLHQTFLPFLDPEIEACSGINLLDVPDPTCPRWRFLEYFGVAVKLDAQYYMRCLELLKNTDLEKDILVRIYEQIQAFYSGNEDTIGSLFREKALLCLPKKNTKNTCPFSWFTITEAADKLPKFEAEYPSCTMLFRCLLMIGVGEVGSLVAKATLITTSTPLSEISEIFRDLNKAIQKENPKKADAAMRPLATRPVLPITSSAKDDFFDYLVSTSETSYYFSDRNYLTASFRGIVPLLAFNSQDISHMQDLIALFKAKSRRLSKLVESEAKPMGRISVHDGYTRFLRARAGFIEALVPAHSERKEICAQISKIEAAVASKISKTHTLRSGKKVIEGRPSKAKFASSVTAGKLQLFFTEESITAKSPSVELIELISKHCQIKNATHQLLLSLTLTDTDLEHTRLTYVQHGIHVTIGCHSNSNEPTPARKQMQRYAGSAAELHTISSPFTKRKDTSNASSNSIYNERQDGFWLQDVNELGPTDQRQARQETQRQPEESRGMPFLNIIQHEENSYKKDEDNFDTLPQFQDDKRGRLQYMGELVALKFLQEYMGSCFNHALQWTSPLRSRAGHPPFTGSADSSAFTLIGDSSERMASVLEDRGILEASAWREAKPSFHIDLGVTAGDRQEAFHLSIEQFERFRKYRLQPTFRYRPSHISILIRITNVYTKPTIEAYTNPWQLFESDRLCLTGRTDLMAILKDEPCSVSHRTLNSYASSYNTVVATATMQRPTYTSVLKSQPIYGSRVTSLGTPRLPYICSTLLALTPSPEEEDGKIHSKFEDLEVSIFPNYSLRYWKLAQKEIRLLNLLPADEPEYPLRAVVFHVPIESAGNFRTLSYVWGTEARSSILETPAGRLPITASLFSALRHIRQRKDPLILWVDAICIDQSNMQEKAEQIRLLPHVFQQATSTLAFLGDEPAYHSGMKALMQIRAKKCSPTFKNSLKRSSSRTETKKEEASSLKHPPTEFKENINDPWPQCLPPIPSSWDTRPIPPPDDPVWDDIIKLFENPWFRRIWVIQEVVMAASVRVLCGKWVVEWNDLFSAVETIDHEFCTSSGYSSLATPWDRFLQIAMCREMEARKSRRALIGLLESFRYAKSTLTRDRFFALLGFAADSENPAFEPDYESPLEAIVCRIAQAFILQGKIMLLLYRAGLCASSEAHAERFPTWVPDWTVPKPPCLWESSHRGVQFAASWIDEPRVKSGSSITEVAVHGVSIDTVERVSLSSCLPDHLGEYLSEVDQMVDALHNHPYGHGKMELKWKVPVAGAKYPRSTPDSDTDIYTSYKALRRFLQYSTTNNPPTATKTNQTPVQTPQNWEKNEGGLAPLPSPNTHTSHIISQNYRRALFECLEGWRLFVTKKGYVGVAPGVVQMGDELVIFDGSAVPFLVRGGESREGDGLMYYRLVGECYVSGLMQGEAMELGRGKKWFDLR